MHTYFIDLDGTLLRHHGSGAVKQWQTCDVLPGVLEWFDAREKEGAFIVLTTARKESCRPRLEADLRAAGIFWDVLLMGLPHGPRTLINDIKAGGTYSAFAKNVERNGTLE
jgi:hypothetical protein